MDATDLAGEVSPADCAQFFMIAEDMRDEILKAQRTITAAVSGLVGKEQAEALEACSREVARATAAIERLETRPQQDLQGTLDDILHTIQRPSPRAPWWLWATCLALAGGVGVCLGWASKPQLFLSPVPQIIHQAECPGTAGAARKGAR
jgi:hypothetical protein